jgi:hypothetical protein
LQTFVVRIWSPPAGLEAAPDELRGVVEHLGTGLSQPFRDDEELLAFLHARPGEPTPPVGRVDTRRPADYVDP